MATKAQREASRGVMSAVNGLNTALSIAAGTGLTVQLEPSSKHINGGHLRYVVATIESREQVLPDGPCTDEQS